MERFEAWLSDQGIAIAGQAATGSGDMVVYQLRLPNNEVIDVAFSLQELVEQPDRAIEEVQRLMAERSLRRRSNGH